MCSLSSWLSAATSTKGEALAKKSIALTQCRARRRTRRCSQLSSIAPEKNLSVCRKELIELSKCGVSHADIGIQEIVDRQSRSHSQTMINLSSMEVGVGMGMVNSSMDCTRARFPQPRPAFLQDAYDHCRRICANTSTSFYLATLLMTKERQKAIWAIYVWGSRTDELVDGHNARHMSGEAVLDQWEERLEDIFRGCPYDMLDAALADTVQKFPIDIKPFKDLLEGMRMDTRKFRYENFKELYLYCYYVAGTVALMTVPVLGIAPESTTSPSAIHSIYDSALYLGIGSQLTNILRDVTEDASMGRVYLPQDELAQFGLCDGDIMSRKVSDGWKGFTKEQIKRARFYFNMAEKGVSQLHKDSRLPVWSSLLLYRTILDTIEENNYDNLTKRASIGIAKKIFMLPLALRKVLPISNLSFSPSHYSP